MKKQKTKPRVLLVLSESKRQTAGGQNTQVNIVAVWWGDDEANVRLGIAT